MDLSKIIRDGSIALRHLQPHLRRLIESGVSSTTVTSIINSTVTEERFVICRLCSDVDVSLSTPDTTIDGITAQIGDLILLIGQNDLTENGIYFYGTTLERAKTLISGMLVSVTEGMTLLDKIYKLTSDSIVLETTDIIFIDINISLSTILAAFAGTPPIYFTDGTISLHYLSGLTLDELNNLIVDKNYLEAWIKNRLDYYEEGNLVKTWDGGGEIYTGINTLYGDKFYYWIVRLQGEIFPDASTNNLNFDMQNNVFYAYLKLTAPNGDQIWYSQEIDLQGSYSTYDVSFIICTDIYTDDVKYTIEIFWKITDVFSSSEIIPIDYYDTYYQSVTLEKNLKSNWEKRYDIPESDYDAVTPKTDILPVTGDGFLPFDGYYNVDIYLKVIEEVTIGDAAGTVITPQTLEIKGNADSYREIDRSGRYINVAPPNNDKWMNFSLQGSDRILIDNNTDRVMSWQCFLPNGTNKQVLTGSYAVIKYIGDKENINRYPVLTQYYHNEPAP
jgi:hypothetical protein